MEETEENLIVDTTAYNKKGMALCKPAGLKRTEMLSGARFSVYPHWRSYLRAHGSFRIQDNSSWEILNWKVICVSQGRQDTVALASTASYWSIL